MGEGQRESQRHRNQSRLQTLSCQHRARCEAGNHEPWGHDLSRSLTLNWLSHPGTPMFYWFLRARETEHEWGRGRERGRQRIQNRLWAVSAKPDVGLIPWTMRSWPELKSDAQLTEPPRRPELFLNKYEKKRWELLQYDLDKKIGPQRSHCLIRITQQMH